MRWFGVILLVGLSPVAHADVNCPAFLSAAQLRAVASRTQKAIAAVLLHGYVTGITVRWQDVKSRTVEVLEDARGHYDFTQLNLEHAARFSITIQSQNPRFPSETFAFALDNQVLALSLTGPAERYVSVKNRRMLLAIYAALAMVPDARKFTLEFSYIVEREISRLRALPQTFGALQMVTPTLVTPVAVDQAQLKVEYARP